MVVDVIGIGIGRLPLAVAFTMRTGSPACGDGAAHIEDVSDELLRAALQRLHATTGVARLADCDAC